jgi:hypothetical protein
MFKISLAMIPFLASACQHDLECRAELERARAELRRLAESARATVPAFMKYIRRSKSTEATMNVRRLADSAMSYYEEEHADRSGAILSKQFPVSAGPTPAKSCCGHPGNKCPPDADQWTKNPTWNALNFSVDDPHYFRLTFLSSGTGDSATFTARAEGDLDCKGVVSTFERTGRIQDGKVVIGPLKKIPPGD